MRRFALRIVYGRLGRANQFGPRGAALSIPRAIEFCSVELYGLELAIAGCRRSLLGELPEFAIREQLLAIGWPRPTSN